MLEGRKVLWVAGGRNFRDEYMIHDALYEARIAGGYDVVITGAARGADLLAEETWRSRFQLPYVGIPAQWGLYGKKAGYRRNSEIAHLEPDALLAMPGGKGTQHARDLARELRIDIL